MTMHHSHTDWIEIAGTEVKCDITFTVSPIIPETGPSYSSGGEPASGGEVEIVSATLHTEGMEINAPGWLTDIMANDEDLLERLFDAARDDIYGEEEDAADRRYDEMRDERNAA